MLEIAKNKADKIIVQKELEREKNVFINEINNGIGNEILTTEIVNKPIKIKKTFKTRFSKFKIRLKKILGLDNGT